MSTKPWWEETWSARSCPNTKHGPQWKCHNVMGENGDRVLGGLTLPEAQRFAAAPEMARALRDAYVVLHRPCTPAFKVQAMERIKNALAKAGVPLP